MVWLAAIMVMPVLKSSESIDYSALDTIKSWFKTNQALQVAKVELLTLTNSSTWLLALGTTANKVRSGSDVWAQLDTRKVAEAKARKAAAEFLRVEVSSEDKLIELRITERVTTSQTSKVQVSKLIRLREEIITQKSKVIFGGSRTVATWLSDDGDSFNAVVAFKITGKELK